jgi:hypothetical protein
MATAEGKEGEAKGGRHEPEDAFGTENHGGHWHFINQ